MEEVIKLTIIEIKSLLVFLWSITFITLLVSALTLKPIKSSWGDFWTIYLFSLIISGISLFFIMTNPEQIIQFFSKVKSFF